MNEKDPKPLAPEVEHKGSIWTHPYMIYVLLTTVLFVLLGFMAWLAWTNGWIPNNSVGQ